MQMEKLGDQELSIDFGNYYHWYFKKY